MVCLVLVRHFLDFLDFLELSWTFLDFHDGLFLDRHFRHSYYLCSALFIYVHNCSLI